MKYYSEEFFRKIVGALPINEQQRTFSSRMEETFDIFISYNINDQKVVRGIYMFLKGLGYKVYVDFIVDPHLNRGNVNKITTSTIQKRLKNSKSLIYAQSENAAMSKWMPWELGVVDGNTGKCMIMPVQKGTETIKSRQEYLMLYPVIGLDALGGLIIRESETAVYGKTLKTYLGL